MDLHVQIFIFRKQECVGERFVYPLFSQPVEDLDTALLEKVLGMELAEDVDEVDRKHVLRVEFLLVRVQDGQLARVVDCCADPRVPGKPFPQTKVFP